MKTSELALKAGGEGLTPVELLLNIVRDESQPLTFRAQCAGIVLPFTTPRLSSVTVEKKPNNAVLDRLLNEIKAHQAVPAVSAPPLLLQAAPQAPHQS